MDETINSTSSEIVGIMPKFFTGFKKGIKALNVKKHFGNNQELENLQLQAELASKLFDEIPASVIIIDKDGIILAVNKNFTIYTSKEGRAMIGRSLLESTEIKNPKLAQKYKQLLKEGKPFSDQLLEHYAELQDKSYTMSLSAVPLKNSQGQVVGAVSIAQDVTFLNEMQDKLEEANRNLSKRIENYAMELVENQKQLEQSLVSRNQFFADASHELRTPLTILKGNLDLIFMNMEQSPLPLDVLEKLKTVNEEVRRMSELLEDITFLNRTEDIRQKPVLSSVSLDLLLAGEAKEFLAPAEKKNIQLTVSSEPVEVIADEKAIKKVIRNLLSNAARYTGAGGQIKVFLSVDENFARIEVADTGMGISKQDLPNIFDRFYRADKVRNRLDGGSGLGLAICQEIMEEHGGKIKVTSQLGKGTTFILLLPIKRLRPSV